MQAPVHIWAALILIALGSMFVAASSQVSAMQRPRTPLPAERAEIPPALTYPWKRDFYRSERASGD